MLSLLLIVCPIIFLQPVDDPVGSGREWYRLYRVCGDNNQPPTFDVEPKGTYFEQWQDDTDGDGRPELGPGNLVWFAGPNGVYRVLAFLPCGASTEIRVEVKH